jgi:Mn2+/Fe2+ NRAMP family transporter
MGSLTNRRLTTAIAGLVTVGIILLNIALFIQGMP